MDTPNQFFRGTTLARYTLTQRPPRFVQSELFATGEGAADPPHKAS
jgi:hypothetical protein